MGMEFMAGVSDAQGHLSQAKSSIYACTSGQYGEVTGEQKEILWKASQQVDEVLATLMSIYEGL